MKTDIKSTAKQTDRMHQGAVVVVLLGLVGVHQGVPLSSNPLYTTQENFDLDRFMGKWHDVATATNCPWMKHRTGEMAVGSLELEKADAPGKVTTTRTSYRHDECKQTSGEYELSDTPGRFNYHIAKWGVDVDTYVLHTDYDQYAIVITSKEKADQNRSTSVKLYCRTMTADETGMAEFHRVTGTLGLDTAKVIIKKDKGECTPGEPAAVPLESVSRKRRNVVLPVLAAEEQGSGDDTSFFRSTEACMLQPDGGPCFGLLQRYFYNSTSMSCQSFGYGGCAGNQNNFLSERECLQSCRTEASCRLPMAASPCSGQPPVWAFDSSRGLCLPYKQGYCQGNSNKFYSKAECEEYCGVVKDGEGEFLQAN
ncbi:protein AMBP-like isoform X2 [Hypomesus transpacificus]|uniref:protein AMBP-like isoform X2 n=1 Tax=Hypomesus transpacificus TaxID=137520 RepID=UPI001F08633C|nr:protein AMBP-like isoform X2 [Hypomesus transpacificus]